MLREEMQSFIAMIHDEKKYLGCDFINILYILVSRININYIEKLVFEILLLKYKY